MNTPTKTGWYRARWPYYDTWSCVLVTVTGSEASVYDPGVSRWRPLSDVVEWGPNVDGLQTEVERLTAETASLRAGLQQIIDIRDSMVDAQTLNWYEHVYPLVAALNSAGFAGADSDDARKRIGTLVERCRIAEARVLAECRRRAHGGGE